MVGQNLEAMKHNEKKLSAAENDKNQEDMGLVKSVNLLPKKRNKKATALASVGAVLLVASVATLTGVIIYRINDSRDEQGEEVISGGSSCNGKEDGEMEEAEEIEETSQLAYDGEYAEVMEDALVKVKYGDVAEVLAIYLEYENKVTGEQKVKLLYDKLAWLVSNDVNKEYGGQAIDTALELDGMLEDINSATTVVNTANYYGNEILMEQYNAILQERSEANGLNNNPEETVG
ncbi:hypothetical protein IJJ37_00710 [Candidatus Saccharibacteria bacterium]|nr:hypothetical protein [Candidatus Saccharibacteria bacterium]